LYGGLLNRETLQFNAVNPIHIKQTGNTLSVTTPGASGLAYHGDAVQHISSSTKGRVIWTECRSDTDLSAYVEVVNLKGTAGPNGGQLQGLSIVRTQLGEVGRCRWKLSRIDDQTPLVASCPCCP
jgi:hypothetical protein